MAATLSGVSLSTSAVAAKADSTNTHTLRTPCVNNPWKVTPFSGTSRMYVRARAAPEGLTNKVEESIKTAEEVCAGDPVSGECAAAWDEVEEVSAAASDARLKKKSSDPLEEYCKDNMEADECRTYED
ncbi:hypothetical protein GIB67_039674 [Kingdonia uniflora]|uniref:CP12 domain-containing protein n=1 Tax=Kingdonia uniflora TaxID=39325 RepID=A0A7J7MPU9_9MAGN|nr:hypothetical protein GIB67_039674 [Kingdonia uniflora]